MRSTLNDNGQMKFKKLLLVSPSPDKEWDTSYTSTGTVVPPGLCSIATVARESFPGLEITVYDGDVEPEEDIEKTVAEQCDSETLVGISCKMLNHENCKVIGKIAKQKGAAVAIGGQYVSSRGLIDGTGEYVVPPVVSDILGFNDMYDYSVQRDGEFVIVDLIKGKSPEDVPNLCYRKDGEVVMNPLKLPDLDDIPIADRSFVEKYMPEYSRRFKEMFKIIEDYTHEYKIAYYSQKGCHKATKCGPCAFCSIPNADRLRQRNPELVWKELRELKEKYGDILAYDICDDFLGDREYFESFRKAKPPDLKVALRVYLKADDVDEERLKQLKEIGVTEVNLGAESFNAVCLRTAGKKATPKDNYNAIKLLTEYDFITDIGIIFGFSGETKESVRVNLDFMKACSNIPNFRYYNSVSIVIPYRGSMIFNKLYLGNKKYQTEEYRNYPRKMILDMLKEWVKNECEVDMDYLEDAIDEGLKYAPIKISLSRTLGKY